MNISGIDSLLSTQNNSEVLSATKNLNNHRNSFSDILSNSINELNKEQLEGYTAMEGIATGKVENLQQAVQQIEEADLSLKLGLEVKNKALGAYKQIMNMSI